MSTVIRETNEHVDLVLSARLKVTAWRYGYEQTWTGLVHDMRRDGAIIATSRGHETAEEALAGAQAQLVVLRDELLALFPVGGAS